MNLKRKEDVVEYLCADAAKRHVKMQSFVEMQTQKLEPPMSARGPSKDSKVHLAALFDKRFNKEYQLVDAEGKGSLDFPAFETLLLNFGCISGATGTERAKELWTFLGGDTTLPKPVAETALRDILRIPREEDQSLDVFCYILRCVELT